MALKTRLLYPLFVTGLITLQCEANAQHSINTYDSLRVVLEAMFDSDQNIRRILVDSVGIDSPEAPKYLSKMAVIDAENKAKIELLLEKYGWIEKSKIGEKAAEGIFYVVQHTELSFMEKYFPQLKLLAERGEANMALCAMMEDRILMWKGKKQKYGTQATSTLRSNQKYAIWPIENPSQVNELRKKAGFPMTVEENAKRLNAEYDPNEKLPEKK